jgi:hypothetical protein
MGCGSTQSHGGGRWSRPRRSWARTPAHRASWSLRAEELLYLLGEAAELEHPSSAPTCTRRHPPGRTRSGADGRAGANRGGLEASDQPTCPAGDDPPGPGKNLLAALGGSASSRPPQPSPALSLRTRDPADPGAVQRTDAAAIPPHRAARRHGHLDDGRPTGGDRAAASDDDWTTGAAGAAGLLQHRAAVPRDRARAARLGRPLRGRASLRVRLLVGAWVEWSGVGSVESGRAPVGRVGRHERAKAATRKPPRRRHLDLFMTGQPHGEVPVFNGPFVD